MMTPAHCDKSPLKEITLRTKEKQLLQGRRYFDKIHHVHAYFSFSHISQMRKATHVIYSNQKKISYD
jgi:hypothetical protein